MLKHLPDISLTALLAYSMNTGQVHPFLSLGNRHTSYPSQKLTKINPTSEAELQLLQWAAPAAARAHRRASDLFVFGSAGTLLTHWNLVEV